MYTPFWFNQIDILYDKNNLLEIFPVKEYDLVISNWCLSELNYEGITFYLENVINKCQYGYFLINFVALGCDEKQDFLINGLKKIFSSVIIEKEYPRTNAKQNYVLLCSK